MVEAIKLVDAKITSPEEAENLGPLMASIREGLKTRYGDEVALEVADKPYMLLTFSEAVRQKYGINAAIVMGDVMGDETAALKERHWKDRWGKCHFAFEDPSKPEQRIILNLQDAGLVGYADCARGVGVEYYFKTGYKGWTNFIYAEFKGERPITDKSMVVVIITTDDLEEELIVKSRTDKNIKIPTHFLWVDNQFPQTPKAPITPVI